MYSACDTRRHDCDLELCTIADGGHTGPGGIPLPIVGKTRSDVKAIEMILDFFDKHPLP